MLKKFVMRTSFNSRFENRAGRERAKITEFDIGFNFGECIDSHAFSKAGGRTHICQWVNAHQTHLSKLKKRKIETAGALKKFLERLSQSSQLGLSACCRSSFNVNLIRIPVLPRRTRRVGDFILDFCKSKALYLAALSGERRPLGNWEIL